MRSSVEYTTASEDDAESDAGRSSAGRSPQPFLNDSQTSDKDARRMAQIAQAGLDEDMQKILSKANELRVQH